MKKPSVTEGPAVVSPVSNLISSQPCQPSIGERQQQQAACVRARQDESDTFFEVRLIYYIEQFLAFCGSKESPPAFLCRGGRKSRLPLPVFPQRREEHPVAGSDLDDIRGDPGRRPGYVTAELGQLLEDRIGGPLCGREGSGSGLNIMQERTRGLWKVRHDSLTMESFAG